jgi:hypothetical protein
MAGMAGGESVKAAENNGGGASKAIWHLMATLGSKSSIKISKWKRTRRNISGGNNKMASAEISSGHDLFAAHLCLLHLGNSQRRHNHGADASGQSVYDGGTETRGLRISYCCIAQQHPWPPRRS